MQYYTSGIHLVVHSKRYYLVKNLHTEDSCDIGMVLKSPDIVILGLKPIVPGALDQIVICSTESIQRAPEKTETGIIGIIVSAQALREC